jgi:spermidine synthase
MLNSGDWFTEAYEDGRSALSLRLARRVHAEQTPFQRIEVLETESFGTLMVIDGCVMLTDRDNFIYHEMMSHPALFTHPAPRRVAIIGGGDCGTLREVLRHPGVERATQVEIDERVTRVAEIHFPELCAANGDPRAELRFADGIRWMQDLAPASLDVIIIDSTDPVGPAEGLFREPFYRDCHRALRAGGLVVQQSESPLFHAGLIRDLHRATRAAGFADSATLCFPQCTYPSGWWSATLACKDGSATEFREADARDRPFATRYYSAEVHRGALALPPFLQEALAG